MIGWVASYAAQSVLDGVIKLLLRQPLRRNTIRGSCPQHVNGDRSNFTIRQHDYRQITGTRIRAQLSCECQTIAIDGIGAQQHQIWIVAIQRFLCLGKRSCVYQIKLMLRLIQNIPKRGWKDFTIEHHNAIECPIHRLLLLRRSIKRLEFRIKLECARGLAHRESLQRLNRSIAIVVLQSKFLPKTD